MTPNDNIDQRISKFQELEKNIHNRIAHLTLHVMHLKAELANMIVIEALPEKEANQLIAAREELERATNALCYQVGKLDDIRKQLSNEPLIIKEDI